MKKAGSGSLLVERRSNYGRVKSRSRLRTAMMGLAQEGQRWMVDNWSSALTLTVPRDSVISFLQRLHLVTNIRAKA